MKTQRNKLTALCLLLFLATCLLACGGADVGGADPGWEAQAELSAKQTPEELYEAALAEGTLTIYSNTTRIYDTQEAFEDAYPGLITDVQFVRATDLINLLETESSVEDPVCDLVICTDSNALLSNQFVPEGLLYKYVPHDISEKIKPENNGVVLDFMIEAAILFYNDDVYDAPPLTNWWELTEPRFKGRFYMVDPLRSHTTNALMFTMIEHSDEMAQAYYDLYGVELDVPEGSSAGQEFWRMLLQNDVQFTSSSDEALEQVGMPGQADPPVAILVSSKERKTDLGYSIAPIYEMQPAAGVLVPCSIMMHGGSENVNAAKLFIRFLLGEADGKGAGFTPYMHEGSWSVRTDVATPSAIQPEDVDFWILNRTFFAERQQEYTDYWTTLREETA
ncbi:extracellular solute-binding protein [Christensenellaceae bacterium OttesenSCG-928-K19]|nr:extracellular solute-binding protein [Christensenellaceae bacterium OttesenSCG-928-K19]